MCRFVFDFGLSAVRFNPDLFCCCGLFTNASGTKCVVYCTVLKVNYGIKNVHMILLLNCNLVLYFSILCMHVAMSSVSSVYSACVLVVCT